MSYFLSYLCFHCSGWNSFYFSFYKVKVHLFFAGESLNRQKNKTKRTWLPTHHFDIDFCFCGTISIVCSTSICPFKPFMNIAYPQFLILLPENKSLFS